MFTVVKEKMSEETLPKLSRTLQTQRPALLEFERTLGLIKPNAMSKNKAIESAIEKAGLFILHKRRVYLKPEQARDIFLQPGNDNDDKEYEALLANLMKRNKREPVSTVQPAPVIKIEKNKPESKKDTNFKELIEFLTSGPVEVLVIAGRGAVSRWLHLIGPEDPKVARELQPESLRAKFGADNPIRNAVHGSKNRSQAEREIRFFFPDAKFEADFKLGASGEYLSKTVNPILLKGLIQLCRQKPDNPLVWLADWLLANNPNRKA